MFTLSDVGGFVSQYMLEIMTLLNFLTTWLFYRRFFYLQYKCLPENYCRYTSILSLILHISAYFLTEKFQSSVNVSTLTIGVFSILIPLFVLLGIRVIIFLATLLVEIYKKKSKSNSYPIWLSNMLEVLNCLAKSSISSCYRSVLSLIPFVSIMLFSEFVINYEYVFMEFSKRKLNSKDKGKENTCI